MHLHSPYKRTLHTFILLIVPVTLYFSTVMPLKADKSITLFPSTADRSNLIGQKEFIHFL